LFQVEKAGGRSGGRGRTEKMRIFPKGRVLADQEEKRGGRDGRVLEYRADRRPLELFHAGVVAGRRRRRRIQNRQRKRRRGQDDRVHDHREPRRGIGDAGPPSPTAAPPEPEPAPSAAAGPGDRGRRAHRLGSGRGPAHGDRDEREPDVRASAGPREDEAREEGVAGGETRAESGQNAGHHNRRVRRLLAAVFHHGAGDAAVPGVRHQRVRVQLLPVARLLQFHSKSDHLHRVQPRIPVGVHQNDLWQHVQEIIYYLQHNFTQLRCLKYDLLKVRMRRRRTLN